jgi:multicomponent Na+:H+ antiporter subunit C
LETLIAAVVGILFAVGTYLILSRVLLRVVFGISLLSHATLLYLITMGKLKAGASPILESGITAYADPIPQALILTAIVINFGVTAFIIVLAYRSYQTLGSDDTEDFRGTNDEQ